MYIFIFKYPSTYEGKYMMEQQVLTAAHSRMHLFVPVRVVRTSPALTVKLFVLFIWALRMIHPLGHKGMRITQLNFSTRSTSWAIYTLVACVCSQ